MKTSAVSLLALAAALGWSPLAAQTADLPQAQDNEPDAPGLSAEGDFEADSDIVVVGTRLRGSVIGDIPPEISLDPQDIRAYGAGSVAELLEALSPQTSSGRGRSAGRPVVLVNGQRISGFSEIRNIPPEAIERVDILPEEVALKYGYRADQRVVNFVLRERFRAVTAEVEGGGPTGGGRADVELDANMLRLRGDTRLIVDGEYEYQSRLLESERDVIAREGDSGEEADYRTLLPATENMSLGVTYTRPIGDIGATVNGRVERTGSESLLGLPDGSSAPFEPLVRDSESWTGHGGFALNGTDAAWRWSATGNYDHVESTSLTDRSASLTDRAKTNTDAADLELVANGSLFRLPAGEASTTLKVGGQTRHLSSAATRGGAFQETSLSRTQGNMQANIDLPISSSRDGVLDGIGTLSANFNAAMDQLSDFGTLWTYGGGVNWEPVDDVRLIASVTQEDGAPTIQQLGDPLVLTPNVRVFDFTTGETVDISRLDGGNPALLADSRRVMKIGLNVKPIKEADLTLSADFISTRIRNPIASFPTATPEIEAAFPDRFIRDDQGRLVQIDNRPVNFERSDRQELRWGLNFSKPLKPSAAEQAEAERRRAEFMARREARQGQQAQQGGAAQTEGQAGAPGQERGEGPPRQGAGRGPGGGGGAGGFRFGGGGRGRGGPEGRLQFSLYHTWRFKDEVLIRDGVPELDLLDGSATGSRGGQPRHTVEARAGVFKKGLGARLNVDWQAATRVLADPASPATSSEDLFFSDFTTVGLRFFADLGQQPALVKKWRFLRGSRVSLEIDNVFDARLDVRDRAGVTPISYQPDLLDPLGRSVRLSFRKIFF